MNKKTRLECLHYMQKEKAQCGVLCAFELWLKQVVFQRFELPYLEFFITTRCNLKCKKCSNLIPAINPHTDISPEDFKKTLDALLGKIDCLYRLKLHGGEVLLHPHLDEIIEYANKQKKIKSIRIATNGTIIPSERILKSLENSKVVVQISDYKLPEAKIEQLKSILEGASVKYAFLENQKWRDMGDFAKRETSRYSECSIKRCTSLFQGKIYLCSKAAMMKHLFQTGCQREGICVFADTKTFRAQMKTLYEGKMSDACFFCDGDTHFAKEIEAGEQQ